jgi:FkbM family methyltransferase
MDELTSNTNSHNKESQFYADIEKRLLQEVKVAYSKASAPQISIDQGIELSIPFFDMGSVNTTHLFGLDEVMILAFYKANKNRYKKVLDLGANVGLHSIALNKLGMDVTCFEADPQTFSQLESNLKLNQATSVHPINAAAGSYDGFAEFTRVCGNLTGSHLSGAKPNPYGKLERFDVTVVNIGSIAANFDLIKIDIEGQESDVLTSISISDAQRIDFMLEVNGDDNAEIIFDYVKQVNMNIFAQHLAWQKVETLDQLPRSYKDGSVFISSKSTVPWS